MATVTILLSDEIFALLEQKAAALGVTPAQAAGQILAEQFASNGPDSAEDSEFIAAMTASLGQNSALLRRLGNLDDR